MRTQSRGRHAPLSLQESQRRADRSPRRGRKNDRGGAELVWCDRQIRTESDQCEGG